MESKNMDEITYSVYDNIPDGVLERLLELWRSIPGKGDISKGDVESRLRGKDYRIVVARDGDDIVGALVGYACTHEELLEQYPQFDRLLFASPDGSHNNILYLWMEAVDRKYRNRGIGEQMIREMIEQFPHDEYPHVCMIIKYGPSTKRLVEKLGAESGEIFQNYGTKSAPAVIFRGASEPAAVRYAHA